MTKLAKASLRLFLLPSWMRVSTHSLKRARALVNMEHLIVVEPIVDVDVPVLSSTPLVVVADTEAELDIQAGEYESTIV